jgi:hypothetical protein
VSMDFYDRRRASLANQKKAEADGIVADSMEVRLALVAKVHSGEMTLEQVQAELKRIKRTAKANGKITRSQAYHP